MIHLVQSTRLALGRALVTADGRSEPPAEAADRVEAKTAFRDERRPRSHRDARLGGVYRWWGF